MSSSEYAKFIIAVAWACSSWTKANVGGAPLIFRKRLSEGEKKIVACFHMLIVYALLRWLKIKSLPSPHVISLPPLVALISELFWCYLPTCFIEESIHFLLLRHFMHIRNSTCLIIKGRPVLDGTKDDDCCVCYGVGIGNGPYYSDDPNMDSLGVIENYCKVSHHVAHRDCMFKWLGISVVSRLGWQNSNLRLRPIPTCPICRGEIIFEVIQKNLLEKEEIIEGKNKNNWLRKLGALIKDWRNVMDWRWIIVRVEVTTVYILMVWRILKWREKIIRSLTYYNRNLTNS
ncbi:hypothetical protein RhiirA5_370878 [Rhizophagus irregularis]|uniref:Uncharacterized protein n=1 Tax=Rhizophagus irregularis TaxID=588596 RepID=A0A2I1FY79_9GLOM|nr:hypothetical protein RhiirA5_370878 [Rhizophagus irregularis]PKY21243.1 hypothetical protein RhiirB3_385519 [Rhizophagus irregularis]PKY39334.1 hypothetical protein RhiirA4_414942 [Rhizophagus irregularis]